MPYLTNTEVEYGVDYHNDDDKRVRAVVNFATNLVDVLINDIVVLRGVTPEQAKTKMTEYLHPIEHRFVRDPRVSFSTMRTMHDRLVCDVLVDNRLTAYRVELDGAGRYNLLSSQLHETVISGTRAIVYQSAQRRALAGIGAGGSTLGDF